MTFSIERDDWLRHPGRRLDLCVGPFMSYVSTADEGWLAFELMFSRIRFGWEVKGRP